MRSRNLYYLLKPAIPRTVRLALRRFRARGLRHRFRNSWPINEAAGRAPVGWPGWPDGKELAFVLTHDVEGKRGVARCRRLAELEMRLGFRSAFNFVPEGEYVAPEPLRAFLIEHGFEVCVHDLHHDGKLYRSWESFKDDARKINHYLASWGAVGFRSGFMLHNLRWLRELNIQYDALPYTLPQDSTLFLVLQEKATDVWKRKLDWVAAHGGLALLNAHPDYMSFDGRPGSSEYAADLYADFLADVNNRYRSRCWFALPRDVAAYVRRHGPAFTATTARAVPSGAR